MPYSKIKPWQREIKVPQNASLAYAKYEPMRAGRNMLFPHRWCGIPLSLAAGDRALRRGKFNQGVYSVKNGVKRVWYWLLSAGGEQQQPREEARCSIN